ncbi:MAG: HAD family hydrolase [Candidatus Nanohaloarchaea archaeon]|nr:HAD family hydrolase [Candidatus Nanohaloarchaea archaeon]
MAVREKNRSRASGELFFFFDVDGTMIAEDTGKEIWKASGEGSYQDFHEAMEAQRDGDEPEIGKGNELLLALQEKDAISHLEEAAKELEPTPREGMASAVDELSEHGYEVVAHSAGWYPAIDTVTNGSFDDKIAGQITGEETLFNGRHQKPARIQEYLLEKGIEDPVEDDIGVVHVGDSNTDHGAILYADATGGYGVAIGDTPEAASQVDSATLYVADHQNQDYTAALLHELLGPEYRSTEEFVEDYGLDLSEGYAFPGELADTEKEHEINRAIERLEEIG